jgi:hypothetical protein
VGAGAGRTQGSSTAVLYARDVRIFFKWINGRTTESITESLGVEESVGMRSGCQVRTIVNFIIHFLISPTKSSYDGI